MLLYEVLHVSGHRAYQTGYTAAQHRATSSVRQGVMYCLPMPTPPVSLAVPSYPAVGASQRAVSDDDREGPFNIGIRAKQARRAQAQQAQRTQVTACLEAFALGIDLPALPCL